MDIVSSHQDRIGNSQQISFYLIGQTSLVFLQGEFLLPYLEDFFVFLSRNYLCVNVIDVFKF
jgi:hypothetical protein